MSLFEWRVLRLVVLGHNRHDIAALLDQSVDAIKACQTRLKTKARVNTLRELTRWARDYRVVSDKDQLSQLEGIQLDKQHTSR